jgi:thiamine biosynthesis lipoprotein
MPKMCSEPAAAGHATLHGPTMGTRWSVTCAPRPEAQWHILRQDLAAAVEQVDAQMSPWKPDSDLVRLNHAPVGAWVDLPSEMLDVLTCALDIGCLSQGAFDIGVGALVDAWGFGAARTAPDAAAIGSARSAVHPPTHTCLELDATQGRARKHAAVQIDLCGIAKGLRGGPHGGSAATAGGAPCAGGTGR